MQETRVEQALVREVEKRGGLCWKFVSPGVAGVPDRIVVLPGGKVGFVEVKRPGGKVRKLQHYRMIQLADRGVLVVVVDDVANVGGVVDVIQAA